MTLLASAAVVESPRPVTAYTFPLTESIFVVLLSMRLVCGRVYMNLESSFKVAFVLYVVHVGCDGYFG